MSFNSAHLLPRLVQSVREQAYPHVELIIVDNASTDGTAELLASFEPFARVLRLRENIGYARGMNAGYAASRGAIVVPLNVDTVLAPSFAATAVAHMRQQPDVGVLAPEVTKINQDGTWRFWQEPHDFPSEGGVIALTPLLHVRMLEGAIGDWRPSFKSNGACPVVRRDLVEDLRRTFGAGPFDPAFDTYGEDVDFAFKAWALGWRTMYARDVNAGHVRSYASALEMPDKRGRLRVNLIAERYINALRHTPLRHALRIIREVGIGHAAMVVEQRRKGDPTAARDVAVALRRVIGMLPALIRFRRAHHTWQQIDFAHDVYCDHAPADTRLPNRRAAPMLAAEVGGVLERIEA